MARRVQGPFEQLARYFWEFRLTKTGKALIAGGFVAGFIGSASIDVPIYHLFFPLFFLGAFAYALGLIYRPKLEVHGRVAQRVSAGQTARGTFKITNKGLLPALDVGAMFFGLDKALWEGAPGTTIRVIKRGEQVEVPVTLNTTQRGLYPLPRLRTFTTFPFGICRAGYSSGEAGTLTVVPGFHPLDGIDVPFGARYQPGGITLTSDIGESPEYMGNREYRFGDPARKIDFKAWGRLAKPVVKEFHEEYYCRVALVLDTRVPEPGWRGRLPGRPRREARSAEQRLEAAISLTASIAHSLSGEEYIIDLFAAGPTLHVFRYGRSVAHFQNVLDILASVEPCRTDPFEQVTPALAQELAHVSTIVCVMLDWGEPQRELLRLATESGCATKVCLVHEGAGDPAKGGADMPPDVRVVAPEDIFKGRVHRL